MSTVWQSTINKSGEKVQVWEGNLERVAHQVVNCMMQIFGTKPLEWDDTVWLEWIEPWQEQYIKNYFCFPQDGLVTLQHLEDEINSILEADNG